MSKKIIDPTYFEDTDFSDELDRQIKAGKAKIHIPKRVTMNISQETFKQAQELNTYMGTGYQNVLKMAMFLGMQQMAKQLRENKSTRKRA